MGNIAAPLPGVEVAVGKETLGVVDRLRAIHGEKVRRGGGGRGEVAAGLGGCGGDVWVVGVGDRHKGEDEAVAAGGMLLLLLDVATLRLPSLDELVAREHFTSSPPTNPVSNDPSSFSYDVLGLVQWYLLFFFFFFFFAWKLLQKLGGRKEEIAVEREGLAPLAD